MKRKLRFVLWLAAAVVLALGGLFKVSDDLLPARELTADTAVHFIDVGQGDAALLLSGGQAVLVDAGTSQSADSLVRYLQELGVTELYAAIATHPHADHIGGMAQVIEAFPIGHFYMGAETQNTATYERMLDALDAQGVPVSVPEPGEELVFDSGASVTFLGPADDVPKGNLNDRSLICLFRAGEQDVLLMGDAESAAEQSLLAHYPSLRCDVLKVGHHGADTSSSVEFLRTVQPTTAVISCGVDNDYGHPDPQTLENLSLAGVDDVRITAQSGTVILPLTPSSSSKENAA
ncbi:MAG TPA: MBL fold metallo-hydrolase [Candidatus Agathobaculum intestinipullorum]|nr:MBL fold metallo-hydrolase [Candidatus Agathobaculum intestinipullorum]